MFSVPKLDIKFDIVRLEDTTVRIKVNKPIGKPRTLVTDENHVTYEFAIYKALAREFNRNKIFGFTNWKVQGVGVGEDRFWLYGGNKANPIYLCHSDYAISWIDEFLSVKNKYITFL